MSAGVEKVDKFSVTIAICTAIFIVCDNNKQKGEAKEIE